MRMANNQSDARMHRTPEAIRAKSTGCESRFAKFWQCACCLAPLSYLTLRLLQLLPSLAFFVTNIAEMCLEKRELRFMRIWVVVQRFTDPVSWSGLLRLTYPME